jgi:hypothetical protein
MTEGESLSHLPSFLLAPCHVYLITNINYFYRNADINFSYVLN